MMRNKSTPYTESNPVHYGELLKPGIQPAHTWFKNNKIAT